SSRAPPLPRASLRLPRAGFPRALPRAFPVPPRVVRARPAALLLLDAQADKVRDSRGVVPADDAHVALQILLHRASTLGRFLEGELRRRGKRRGV
ncbi:unnamed protein product, partial [Closterium sp. NIES-54]